MFFAISLSGSLGLVIFYTLLYYLFQTEKIKFGATNSTLKYLFFGISIPLLVYGVQVTSGTDGFLVNALRIFLTIEIMSSFLKMVILSEQVKSNLEFIFTLPTSDKSYLSELKNKLLNICEAISTVGGSPGLKTL